MSQTKPKLLIVDGHALIHRSFHALPTSLTTKEGVVVNAVYGFTSFLLKACLAFKPEYVVITLDSAGPTFRHEEYEDYKGTRAEAPDELYPQVPIVKEVAEALDIPVFEKSGFEADDLIGTITARAEAETDWESYIVTGDMDSLQLVSPRTLVYAMSRGLNESVTYDAEAVVARYGLHPEQIIDYKALRGDPSDNIPGVKGVGEKTATELLQTFHDLEGVYQAAKNNDERIKPRIVKLLLEGEKEAHLSRDLATIRRDVSLKINWESLRLDTFDLEKATELFTTLEFRSLLGRLRQLKSGIKEEEVLPQTTDTPITPDKITRNQEQKKYRLVSTEAEFSSFLKKLQTVKEFALDCETTSLDPLTADLVGLAFAWKENEAFYVDLSQGKGAQHADLFNYQKADEPAHAYLERLRPILENSQIKKIGHNAKFDWRVLKNQGISLKGLAFDTMLADYLLEPDNRQHNLDALAFRELGWEKIPITDLIGSGSRRISFAQVDPEKAAQYAGEDVDCTYLLAKSLSKKLKAESLTKLLDEIELPLSVVLAKMEDAGIKLEATPLKKLARTLNQRLKKLSATITDSAQANINLNSPKQLQSLLFEKLGISPEGIKKTKTGYSTADSELQKIIDAHPIIPLIQEYRELSKLQSTYVTALPQLINPKTGRIHTSYNQTVAATGRLSSTEPNLQNIPTRTEEGRKIREAFVATAGCKLVGLDYSQIELRLTAHLSGDPKLIKAFRDKEDIHKATAAEINGVPFDEVTKKMRYEAKAINFGILYGQGPHGLAQTAKIPYQRAREFIAQYFAAYPKVKKLVDKSIEDARAQGYTTTMLGRKRYLPEINSPSPVARRGAERMAINTPIQGTAADLIKIAMIDIDETISAHPDEVRLLLQIHDELIFEIQEDRVDYWLPKLKSLMENAMTLKVPILVESSLGSTWGDLK